MNHENPFHMLCLIFMRPSGSPSVAAGFCAGISGSNSAQPSLCLAHRWRCLLQKTNLFSPSLLDIAQAFWYNTQS